MYNIRLSWEQLKVKAENHTIKYADANGNYYVYVVISDTEYVCVLDKTSPEAGDFEDNYKENATSIL